MNSLGRIRRSQAIGIFAKQLSSLNFYDINDKHHPNKGKNCSRNRFACIQWFPIICKSTAL